MKTACRYSIALAMCVAMVAAPDSLAEATIYGRARIPLDYFDGGDEGEMPSSLFMHDASTIGGGRVLGQARYRHSDHDVSSRTSIAIKGVYGLTDNAEVMVAPRYAAREDDFGFDESGFGDTRIRLKGGGILNDKYRLYLDGGLSLPTGDEDKGLGSGEMGYTLDALGGLDWKYVSVVAKAGFAYSDGDTTIRYGGEALSTLYSGFGVHVALTGSESDDRSVLTGLGGLRYESGYGQFGVGVGVGLSDDAADWTTVLNYRKPLF